MSATFASLSSEATEMWRWVCPVRPRKKSKCCIYQVMSPACPYRTFQMIDRNVTKEPLESHFARLITINDSSTQSRKLHRYENRNILAIESRPAISAIVEEVVV
jgi:hypothetical protein